MPDRERDPGASRFLKIKIMLTEAEIDVSSALGEVHRPLVLLGIKLREEDLTVSTATACTPSSHSSSQVMKVQNILAYNLSDEFYPVERMFQFSFSPDVRRIVKVWLADTQQRGVLSSDLALQSKPDCIPWPEISTKT